MSNITDITDMIDKSSSYCSNEKTSQSFYNLFEQEGSVLQSNADEQLIIQLSFRQKVTLTGIEYEVENGSDSCPKIIKLYLNKTNLDFSSIENEKCIETHRLSKYGQTQKHNLSRSWQNTDTITFFVEKNHGAEFTSLVQLKIFGKPVECLNVKDIRRGCCC
jgi:hypothetical protein